MSYTPKSSIPPTPLRDDSARAVFLAWEGLRLIYNATLAIIELPIAWRDLSDPAFRSYMFHGAIGANLCSCLGPVAEGYLALPGADRQVARWIIFVAGLILAILLTLLWMFSWNVKNFD